MELTSHQFGALAKRSRSCWFAFIEYSGIASGANFSLEIVMSDLRDEDILLEVYCNFEPEL